MEIEIRTARADDAEALLRIYSYYVENTAITFEYVTPTLEEFRQRIESTLVNYPYLVAEADGSIAAYIYASRFRPRAAYDWAVSTSVYIDKDHHRMGLGRMLYAELERILKQQNIVSMFASITVSEDEADSHLIGSSRIFHEAMGFTECGRYHYAGSKFGRWFGLTDMEKLIGEPGCPPAGFVPFSEIDQA